MGLYRPLQRLFLGFLFFFLTLSSCMARFMVEKNSLTVTSPESIKGTHDSAIGNFGIPQYGDSMAGTVVYPKDNRKGCKGFDEFGVSFQSKPGALPTFVLVDRGESVMDGSGAMISGVVGERWPIRSGRKQTHGSIEEDEEEEDEAYL